MDKGLCLSGYHKHHEPNQPPKIYHAICPRRLSWPWAFWPRATWDNRVQNVTWNRIENTCCVQQQQQKKTVQRLTNRHHAPPRQKKRLKPLVRGVAAERRRHRPRPRLHSIECHAQLTRGPHCVPIDTRRHGGNHLACSKTDTVAPVQETTVDTAAERADRHSTDTCLCDSATTAGSRVSSANRDSESTKCLVRPCLLMLTAVAVAVATVDNLASCARRGTEST